MGRVTSGLWTKQEGRDWDKKNLGVNLTDDDIIQQRADQIKKEYPGQNDEKPLKSENFLGKKLKKCQACKESQHAFCTKKGCQCH